MQEELSLPYSIESIVVSVPKEKQDTNQIQFNSHSEKKIFQKKIGIHEKRISNGKLTTGDLCLNATLKCLTNVGWDTREVGALIFVSQTGDYMVPGTSYTLQKKLNLPSNTFLIDMNIGCTGWVNGLLTAFSLMKTLGIKKALLLNGDTNIIANPNDNSTYRLIGDAGCATAIEYKNNLVNYKYHFGNHGNYYQHILAPNSGARFISDLKKFTFSPFTQMSGTELFDYIAKKVVPEANGFIEKHNIKLLADYFVLHQANALINNFVKSKLQLDKNKCPDSYDLFGNTSSASIPLTICLNNKNNLYANKHLFCLAFGVGLAYSMLFFNTPKSFSTNLIEVV